MPKTLKPVGTRVWECLQSFTPTGAARYKNLAAWDSAVQDGFSEMLGLSIGLGITKATMLNPGVLEVCLELLSTVSWAKNLAVTSVQVNKNFQTAPHRDKANSGLSALIAFGSFTGGELWYWPNDDGGDEWQNTECEILNPRQMCALDGNNLHGTAPFKGLRFSLVFFKITGAANTPRDVQKSLSAMGAWCSEWSVAHL